MRFLLDENALPSTALAELLLAVLPGQLTELLLAGAIATLTPDRVRVRPLPLRPGPSKQLPAISAHAHRPLLLNRQPSRLKQQTSPAAAKARGRSRSLTGDTDALRDQSSCPRRGKYPPIWSGGPAPERLFSAAPSRT
jgi:hypothetical protein